MAAQVTVRRPLPSSRQIATCRLEPPSAPGMQVAAPGWQARHFSFLQNPFGTGQVDDTDQVLSTPQVSIAFEFEVQRSAPVVQGMVIGPASGSGAAPQPAVPRAGYVLVIPARTVLDIAAADYTARAIEAELPTVATSVTQSTGLTAVSQSANLTKEQIDAIVIVTVGRKGSQYLPLIGKRAARAYPRASIVLLDLGGNGLGKFLRRARRAPEARPLFSRRRPRRRFRRRFRGDSRRSALAPSFPTI